MDMFLKYPEFAECYKTQSTFRRAFHATLDFYQDLKKGLEGDALLEYENTMGKKASDLMLLATFYEDWRSTKL